MLLILHLKIFNGLLLVHCLYNICTEIISLIIYSICFLNSWWPENYICYLHQEYSLVHPHAKVVGILKGSRVVLFLSLSLSQVLFIRLISIRLRFGAKARSRQQMRVRMMQPMSIRCNTCGNYVGKGTKFNSRKVRRCNRRHLFGNKFVQVLLPMPLLLCYAEIVMKTYPQNSDYTVECGAKRNFEAWRDDDDDEKIRGSAMESLEKRRLDSKTEMDIGAALDELKSIKARHATVSVDALRRGRRNYKKKKKTKRRRGRRNYKKKKTKTKSL